MISISHKLYGNQRLKCKLDYIFDGNRIGFRVKDGQEKFVYKNDLVDYGTKDGIYFADDLMKIEIKIAQAVRTKTLQGYGVPKGDGTCFL